MIKLWLVALWMLLLHFRLLKRFFMISLLSASKTYLPVIGIIQTLFAQVVLPTYVLYFHLSAVL